MLPHRPNWGERIDYAAVSLLGLGGVVTVAVLGYQPDVAVSRNLLGTTGDWLARSLFGALGQATYLLLVSWFICVVLMFLRHSWMVWARRLAGWLLLIPCTTVLLTWLGPRALAGRAVGPGGAVGAWLAVWLGDRLTNWGAAVVVGAMTLLGILLAADRIVTRPAHRITLLLVRLVRGLRRFLPRKPRPAQGVFARPFKVVEKKEKPLPIKAAKPVTPAPAQPPRPAELPPVELLEEAQAFPYSENDPKLRDTAQLLEKTFADFGLTVRVVGIHTGPVITQYEVALETGLRLNKVTNLADDLALNLRVNSVRVVAPIPGKNTVGIEVPNEKRAVVRLKELITSEAALSSKAKLPLFLGKDSEGRPLIYDLAEMPHLLIAGRTGTGKSVCMNAVILSMLMTRTPEEVRMVMIDPKMLELSEYSKIPHLMHPVVKDMKKAEAILAWAVDKMEERYELLSRARVRSIASYNELSHDEIFRRVNPIDEDERQKLILPMPYIVIFIDEMSDLMMTMKKEVEGHIIRLAQKSRAAGIHLIVATQKPTVDVITGLIKSNLPARICFQVASRTDSRVVLDEMGADKLLGKGDMLFLQPGTSQIIRAQGTFASDPEIARVVDCLECEPEFATELVQLKSTDAKDAGSAAAGLREQLRARDELYEQAIEVVVREGRGSVSLLQRALGIGYGRAARLVDFMAEDGIVGNYAGSQAREVLYDSESWAAFRASGMSLRTSADLVNAG
ncbi:MAG: DNA translocase FtsK [Gemmataceae bacterium]|nr:DNA translocase FtsK [Gemmataceae bacterium]